MSSVILTGDTSGTLTVSAPLVAGSNTVTLPAATGTISLLAQATAVASTSGTSIDFTGIPSWAKRITVMFNGVSTSGTSVIQIQLGDSGGVENTGYAGQTWTASSATGVVSTGMYLANANGAANIWSGVVQFVNISSNLWVGTGISNVTNVSNVGYQAMTNKTLSDTLDRVRITTVNGTDTFDAGSINIIYEG